MTEQILKDDAALAVLYREVSAAMPGLEKMYVFNAVSAVAHLFSINVGLPSSGKSTLLSHFNKVAFKDSSVPLFSLTIFGLKHIAGDLNGQEKVLLIDDVGAINTMYSRVATLSTIAYLVNDHNISELNAFTNFNISGFNGSAIANVQPHIFSSVTKDDNYVANVKDKSLRFYHFYMPKRQEDDGYRSLDYVKINLDTHFKIFNKYEVKYKDVDKLIKLVDRLALFYSRARSLNYAKAMSKAMALINGDHEVDESYYNTLDLMFSNFYIESRLLQRRTLDGTYTFNDDDFSLLTYYMNYDDLSFDTIIDFFDISMATMYNTVKRSGLFTEKEKTLVPLDITKKIADTLKTPWW